jgi:hypothetical protein
MIAMLYLILNSYFFILANDSIGTINSAKEKDGSSDQNEPHGNSHSYKNNSKQGDDVTDDGIEDSISFGPPPHGLLIKLNDLLFIVLPDLFQDLWFHFIFSPKYRGHL